MTLDEKLTKAKVQLLTKYPFFGELALGMPFVKDDSMPWMMGTTGKYIYYNSKLLDKTTIEEIIEITAHECLHPAFRHHLRLMGYPPFKKNVAADYAINPILQECGFKITNGLLEDKFKGMSMEEIYFKLKDKDLTKILGCNGKCDECKKKAQEALEKGESVHQCPMPGNFTDSDKSMSEEEIDKNEQEWKIKITKAANLARSMGKLPGLLEILIDKILEVKVPWEEELYRFISHRVMFSEYCWFPPNRRELSRDLYLPSNRGETLPPILVAVDVSGSIYEELLNKFAGALTGLLNLYDTEIHIIYFDTRTIKGEIFSRDNLPIVFKSVGGGGTDFRPIFTYEGLDEIDPCCIVILTDIEGTFPETEPLYPLLWVKFGNCTIKPPFGRVVEIED